METIENSFTLPFTFQNLIVPAALDYIHSGPPKTESNPKSFLKNIHSITVYVIIGPPVDKRDRITFCNILNKMLFKSVKNHYFFAVFK